MLTVAAIGTAEAAAARVLQQVLPAVLVLEIKKQQSLEAFLCDQNRACVSVIPQALEQCLTRDQLLFDAVMLLPASLLAASAEAETHLQMAVAATVILWAQQQETGGAWTTSRQTVAAAMVTKHWQQHRVKALLYSLAAEQPVLSLAMPAAAMAATGGAAADKRWPNASVAALMFEA